MDSEDADQTGQNQKDGTISQIGFVWSFVFSCFSLTCVITVMFCLHLNMSHIMRKPVLAICEKQRCRSDCASAQSDQHLCCSLLR